MRGQQHLHDAMAVALQTRIEQAGKQDDMDAKDFVSCARAGRYSHSPPVSPEYIGLTREEFLALHAMIYG